MARIFTYGFENKLSASSTYAPKELDGIPIVSNYGFSQYKEGRVSGYSARFWGNSKTSTYAYMNLTETLIGSNNEVYIRLWFKNDNYYSGGGDTNKCDFLVVSNDTTELCKVRIMPLTTASFKFAVYDNADNELYISYEIASLVWHKLDLKVKIGESGQIALKLNDRSIYDSTQNLGTTPIKNIKIGVIKNYNSAVSLYMDDIAINNNLGTTNNSWCGNGYVKKLIPITNGSKIEFTPSANTNYKNLIEDIGDGNTTTNSTDVIGATDLFSLTKISTTENSNTKLNYCKLLINACYTEHGVSLIPVIKDGDQERTLEATALGIDYAYKAYDILTNPSTSLPYTFEELDKLEFGYRNGG